MVAKFDGDLRSCNDIAAGFGLKPYNYNFIKHIKLTAAIPMNWITDEIASSKENFLSFKRKILEQLNIFGISNKKLPVI